MRDIHFHKETEPDLNRQANGIVHSDKLMSRRSRNQDKAAFLLDHFIFTNPMDTASPHYIGTFHELMRMRRYFNVSEKLFYCDVGISRHKILFGQSGFPIFFMERGNDMTLLSQCRRFIHAFKCIPVRSMHHKI